MTQAKKGDKVKVNYKGYLEDGTIFDSSKGNEPLDVVLGSGSVIQGFDMALVGMKAGEKKTVKIPLALAYGNHNAEMVMQVPVDQIPADLKPEIGQKLQIGGANGEMMTVEVLDLTEEFIVLDANPPLAGKDLIFDLELVEIA